VRFGLGASLIESIEIRWPGGAIQKLNHVAADRIVEITEDVEP